MKFEKCVTIEIDERECGKRLARMNSEKQANFFEGLREGFAEFSNKYKEGVQMLYIKDELSMTTRAFIGELAGYICN